ncbi:MAG: winged helix-turn-helix transcriptional regulator [Candidatus Eisenbacteria bacterium]|nr:winged helix-turn-helix transcriptional regulator [Candidatus Eisenbacteria bacterium]
MSKTVNAEQPELDRGSAREPFETAAEILRVLSHPSRLRIIEILSSGELCVKRIEEILGIPQPSVSQHLSRLRYAGLIESERRGHLVCYRLANGVATRVLKAVMRDSESTGTNRRNEKGE